MVIVDRRKTTRKFNELMQGACFVYEGSYFMKMEKLTEWDAVSLDNGGLYHFGDDADVREIRMKGEVL